MPTVACPACRNTLEIEIQIPEGPAEATSTGVAIVCLHCFVPSLILGDGSLVVIDMARLDGASRQELQAAIDEASLRARGQSTSVFKDWVSIMTASEEFPAALLHSSIPSGPIAVYSMPNGHEPVGRALEYEVRGDTLWALLELETDDFSRAFALLRNRNICAVVVTHVSRENLGRIGDDLKAMRKAN